MTDLQRVSVDDDALDDELQDGLVLTEVGILEPRQIRPLNAATFVSTARA